MAIEDVLTTAAGGGTAAAIVLGLKELGSWLKTRNEARLTSQKQASDVKLAEQKQASEQEKGEDDRALAIYRELLEKVRDDQVALVVDIKRLEADVLKYATENASLRVKNELLEKMVVKTATQG